MLQSTFFCCVLVMEFLWVLLHSGFPYLSDYFLTFLISFSLWQELCEVKRKNAALQMQQFVGEEQNDLLDYLRSLQPEKVLFFLFPFSLLILINIQKFLQQYKFWVIKFL